MKEKRSFYLLLIIMTVVALVVMLVTNYVLYQVAFDEKSKSLIQTAQSQARLIEAMARYNRRTNRIDWEVPIGERGPTSLLSERAAADTIAQLVDAHNHYEGFGKTGEFVIAGIEESQIVFLLRHRHELQDDLESIPLYSDVAEPIRRALFAESGVMVGKDYRGVEVLAAYEPVDVLNFGIVAKVDLTEIRAPFFRAVMISSAVAMLVIILGSLLFRRVTNPIVETLINNEKRYRALVEEINEWVWTIDKDGVLTYSSPQIEGFIGRNNDELIGQSIVDLFEPDVRPQASRFFAKKTRKRQSFDNYEVAILSRDRRQVFMEFTATPIFNADGKLVGYRGVAHDITERKQAEQLREQYQRTLERQVEERTKELHNRNEELKEFTYIVSHDLRSPLVSIVGFSSEIKADIGQLQTLKLAHGNDKAKQLIDDVIPESVAYIEHAAEKMQGLINSILSLSRIGERQLTIEQVDTAAIVDKNIKALAFQLDAVNVKVEALPIVESDQLAVEQIFGNIIGNAVKYLQPDRPAEIDIWSENKHGQHFFYIKDNGQGISEKDLPHIFELFKRAGKQDKPGDGMGLTYVQALVRRLGGQVSCDSIEGEGTTFYFSLPMQD